MLDFNSQIILYRQHIISSPTMTQYELDVRVISDLEMYHQYRLTVTQNIKITLVPTIKIN